MRSATFHVRPAAGQRWSAQAGQALLGRDVRYGKLGKVGQVERAVAVDAGRSLRLHVALTRKLASPDRRKFHLAPPSRVTKGEEPAAE